MKKFWALVIFFGILTAQASPNKTAVLLIHHKKISVEIANSPQARIQGLMYRKKLLPNQGMLFVFPKEEVQAFWMKNTSIPLDIVFLNSQGQILSIKRLKPFSTHRVSSNQPCRYALEVNSGFAKKLRLRVEERINLPVACTAAGE